jgi:transcriptional regulator with XRE-family HTH domain
MDIGARLHELRLAKGFSQGDIERRTGLLRCYVSGIEHGHSIPSLQTLEKWARALDVELYQLFFAGKGKPRAPRTTPAPPTRPRRSERGELVKDFDRMSKRDRKLLRALARKMAATEKQTRSYFPSEERK